MNMKRYGEFQTQFSWNAYITNDNPSIAEIIQKGKLLNHNGN